MPAIGWHCCQHFTRTVTDNSCGNSKTEALSLLSRWGISTEEGRSVADLGYEPGRPVFWAHPYNHNAENGDPWPFGSEPWVRGGTAGLWPIQRASRISTNALICLHLQGYLGSHSAPRGRLWFGMGVAGQTDLPSLCDSPVEVTTATRSSESPLGSSWSQYHLRTGDL